MIDRCKYPSSMRIMYAFARGDGSSRAPDWCFWVILLADHFFFFFPFSNNALDDMIIHYGHSVITACLAILTEPLRLYCLMIGFGDYFPCSELLNDILQQYYSTQCLHLTASCFLSNWSFVSHLTGILLPTSIDIFSRMTFWCDRRISSHPSACAGSDSLDVFL